MMRGYSNMGVWSPYVSMGVWQMPRLCYCIYRGQDGNMNYQDIQAVMDLGASQVSIEDQVLQPDTIWHYIRRQVSGCGLESSDSPVCAVIINFEGNMIGDTPNPPVDLTLEGLSNGQFKLRWRYAKSGEDIPPTGFKIYMDSGSGFDFNTPEDTVSYGFGGTGEFEWTSDPLTHGQSYRFCVRSYRTGAGETQNTDYVSGIADAVGPYAITGLRASWEQM